MTETVAAGFHENVSPQPRDPAFHGKFNCRFSSYTSGTGFALPSDRGEEAAMTHLCEEVFFWLPVLVVTLFWAIVVALACRQSKSASTDSWQHPAQELPPLFWAHEDYDGPEEPLTPDELRRLLRKPGDGTKDDTHFNQEGGFSQN
jgi:hypothetical protein